MRLSSAHIILVLSLLTVFTSWGAAPAGERGDSTRVLFIGNSYTFYNKLPKLVDSIARSQDRTLAVTSVVKGGQRLSGHLKNQRLLDLLSKGGWDFVVIQEQSSDPALPTREVARKVYPAAAALDSLVKAGSPEAEVIFYMTWGHKNGHRKPIATYPPYNCYEGMQQRIITSYLEMAYDNDARCAPVGLAWKRVRGERPEMELYAKDDYHPSLQGSYLAANAIYCTMFPEPYTTGFTSRLSKEEAGYLQKVAQETVLDNLRLLNITKAEEEPGK